MLSWTDAAYTLGCAQVCGQADVFGDVIVPEPSAHLGEGAESVNLEGVFHSPIGEKLPFFGPWDRPGLVEQELAGLSVLGRSRPLHGPIFLKYSVDHSVTANVHCSKPKEHPHMLGRAVAGSLPCSICSMCACYEILDPRTPCPSDKLFPSADCKATLELGQLLEKAEVPVLTPVPALSQRHRLCNPCGSWSDSGYECCSTYHNHDTHDGTPGTTDIMLAG
eukprot:scaffold222515_cov19-Tisochrysis_lutea.AAC.1